jgi:ribose 5-phosphate isomerase B
LSQNKRIVLSSDHTAIDLRATIAAHLRGLGWQAVDIGPTSKDSTCGVCSDPFSARMIREHNDANMLVLGVRVVGQSLALDIVDAFVNAEFEGERHAARVDMIKALEI